MTDYYCRKRIAMRLDTIATMTPPATEFTLIRHGETAWNRAGRMQGHLDIPLNEMGRTQAEAIGKRFAAERFDAIYSSDMQRALQTVNPLVRQGYVIQREARLRERHYGVLQGLTAAEAAALHSSVWDKYKARHPDAVIEGGESLREFFHRVVVLIGELCQRHCGQRVMLVTHGGVLDAIYRHVTDMPLDRPRNFLIGNAAVNVLVQRDQRWQVASWGDVSHLAMQPVLDES